MFVDATDIIASSKWNRAEHIARMTEERSTETISNYEPNTTCEQFTRKMEELVAVVAMDRLKCIKIESVYI